MSTFYGVGSGSDLADACFDYFDAIKTSFPSSLTWTIPTAGDTLDDNTGELNGAWTGGAGGTVSGTQGGSFAAGVGARVVWETAGITNGRRVRGSTFLCPLIGGAYDTDGTLIAATRTSLDNASSILTGGSTWTLVILTRLTPAHSGTSHDVVSSTVPDKVSWLRSRRT